MLTFLLWWFSGAAKNTVKVRSVQIVAGLQHRLMPCGSAGVHHTLAGAGVALVDERQRVSYLA
jgi:hypothetical protein